MHLKVPGSIKLDIHGKCAPNHLESFAPHSSVFHPIPSVPTLPPHPFKSKTHACYSSVAPKCSTASRRSPTAELDVSKSACGKGERPSISFSTAALRSSLPSPHSEDFRYANPYPLSRVPNQLSI
ncbi:hypothetical protein AVEN_118812-1 [Araneus ventricosus]|uniref:Uncharacterized protein n=1 Tax=Araneus ventricosus TaxID=182803 RepID=A0A4Y2BXJ3_ARAVE|nr:hypothetical protein AVEN_118812-1 [Araneus ventricosus]